MFEGGKRVQVFDWILLSIEFTTPSGFNASRRASDWQILLKVSRMV
jgi:hypothetical protein